MSNVSYLHLLYVKFKRMEKFGISLKLIGGFSEKVTLVFLWSIKKDRKAKIRKGFSLYNKMCEFWFCLVSF